MVGGRRLVGNCTLHTDPHSQFVFSHARPLFPPFFLARPWRKSGRTETSTVLCSAGGVSAPRGSEGSPSRPRSGGHGRRRVQEAGVAGAGSVRRRCHSRQEKVSPPRRAAPASPTWPVSCAVAPFAVLPRREGGRRGTGTPSLPRPIQIFPLATPPTVRATETTGRSPIGKPNAAECNRGPAIADDSAVLPRGAARCRPCECRIRYED